MGPGQVGAAAAGPDRHRHAPVALRRGRGADLLGRLHPDPASRGEHRGLAGHPQQREGARPGHLRHQHHLPGGDPRHGRLSLGDPCRCHREERGTRRGASSVHAPAAAHLARRAGRNCRRHGLAPGVGQRPAARERARRGGTGPQLLLRRTTRPGPGHATRRQELPGRLGGQLPHHHPGHAGPRRLR
jgi:hypothetical protein